MAASRRDRRFTLRSLVLFIVCCGLSVGAATRLWKFYRPASSTTSTGPRTTRLSDADIDRLSKDIQSSSIQARLAAAVALRAYASDAEQALPLLEQLLRDESVEVRREAIQSIGTFGESARDHVPGLIAALDDEDPAIRQQAIFALGRLGPIAEDAVPSLIRLMDDPDSRVDAIRAIGRIGPRAGAAVHALVEALEDPEPGVRHDTILALMNLEAAAAPATGALVKLLDSDEPLIAERAAMALGNIGPAAEPAVPSLFHAAKRDKNLAEVAVRALNAIDQANVTMLPVFQDAMKSEVTPVRIAATGLVRLIGPSAAPAIPDLVALLSSEGSNEEVETVARSLKQIGPESIPALCEALKSDDPKRRALAACVIAVFDDADARAAVPALTEALDDEIPRVRASAAMALGKNGPVARDALPAIVRALKDQDSLVRKNAAWALGDIGTEDEGHIRELLTLTRDADVRPSAILSLGAIHIYPDLVVPALIELISTPNDHDPNRESALWALAQYGPDAKPAIEALVHLLRQEGNGHYHALAAGALGEIGSDAKDCIPVLIECLSRTNFYGYEAVAEALLKLSADGARDIVPSLAARLTQAERFKHEKLLIVRALARLGPLAESAVPALTMMLVQHDYDAYGEVCYALGEIGPAAASAVPALIDSFQSSQVKPDYKWRYIDVFGKIGPDAREAVPLLIPLLSEGLTEWEVATLVSDPIPEHSRAVWEGRVKRTARALGRIGAAAREAIPRLTELSQSKYVAKRIEVPVPEQLQRRDRSLAASAVINEDFIQFSQTSLQETALDALQRIQSSMDEQNQ